MGARQAGVPDLKLARLARDREALLRARELAGRDPRRRPRPRERRPTRRSATRCDAAFGHELAWLLKA